jgi:fructosamine-3-kinase
MPARVYLIPLKMNNRIIKHIEEQLQCHIVHHELVGGGCIAQTARLTSDDKRSFFLKQGFIGDAFRKEANGLNELRKSQAIRIPEVILVNDEFLLLEDIKSGVKTSRFFTNFGVAYANMHRFEGESFGYKEDNFIGSTPQINTPNNNWLDFYFTHRLLFQYQLAEKNGYADTNFADAFKHLEQRLPHILQGSEEAPCLLHGDLWGGNYLVDENGSAVLIDPAVYYGHREADLAMTKLFGGFTAEFYRSYQQCYPLKEGYQYRENIYLLYHVLNHLNLFGSSYKQQALQLMNSYR